MGINKKCPKCGSGKVQLSNERSKHGLLWLILFGIYYICWIFCKWMIGVIIFCYYDWWMYLVKKSQNKGHIWQSKKWFSGNKRIYYCHDCGHNFKA
ncbi:MAG: hypothetical protein MJ154_01240 [Candidatus Saccharibacteria bacterium]|nr:hypothetical protein [Candidatus Saccharibacteria bacterium]